MTEHDTRQDPEVPPPMRPQDCSEALDWPGCFGAVLGKGAGETLVAALDTFAREGCAGGFAVDLGAGRLFHVVARKF